MFEVRYGSHTGLNSDIAPSPFLMRRLSYRRDLPPERADNPRSELAWMVAAVSHSKTAIWYLIDASADTHFNRGMAW
jgi:hypothetical protein